MEHRSLKLVLLCTAFVVVARPEEVFNTTPPPIRTSFSCRGKEMGFYADLETDCRVYHNCDDYGNRFSYRCPEDTAFRQDALICDHAHLVDCHANAYTEKPSEHGKRENSDLGLPDILQAPAPSDSHGSRTFSRSFQVVQQPDKSSRVRPGFVFSASVFLRDRDADRRRTTEPVQEEERSTLPRPIGFNTCNIKGERTSPGNDPIFASSTLRPRVDRFDARADFTNRFSSVQGDRRTFGDRKEFDRSEKSTTESYEPARKEEPRKEVTLRNNYNRDYAYAETLRSIQANSHTTSVPRTQTTTTTTTEIPVHALTLSLKPLVPNELEYDPYYPKHPTSTEAYYTPSHRRKEYSFYSSTPASWSNVDFEIPDILPDLNTLEDLVDRRKLFYIPRVKPS